jgi:hypothetical protein
MPDELCEVCGGPIKDPPRAGSRIVYLRAGTGAMIIADAEFPLHKCDSLSRDDEQDLLRDAGMMFGDENDISPE